MSAHPNDLVFGLLVDTIGMPGVIGGIEKKVNTDPDYGGKTEHIELWDFLNKILMGGDNNEFHRGYLFGTLMAAVGIASGTQFTSVVPLIARKIVENGISIATGEVKAAG